MDRPLDSDQLGKKGEKAFETYCIDAGLYPNPSTWDRKGWDFVVDWRETDAEASYDKRPIARSCHVQVKTVWLETASVRVSLSAIDHLARELKPAFVAVLKVDNQLVVQQVAVAKLEGEFLAHILKATRQASASEEALSDVELNLSIAKWFKPIAPDARAIRQALEDAIAPSMEACAKRKQDQLRDLGFEEVRLVMQGTILVPDQEALIDGFLGLRDLEMVDATAVETRFGIPLVLKEFGDGAKVKLTAAAIDTCRIIVRSSSRDLPLSFRGKMHRPPLQVLSPGRGKMVIRTDTFAMIIDGQMPSDGSEGSIEVTLSLEGDHGRHRRTIADWADLYSLMADFASHDQLHLEVQPKRMISFSTSFQGGGSDGPGDWARGHRLAEAARNIFGRAGWPGAKATFDEIGAAERPLRMLDLLLRSPEKITPLTIVTSVAAGFDPAAPVLLHCLHHLRVGEHMIVYLVLAEMYGRMVGERIEWASHSLKVLEIGRTRPTRKAVSAWTDSTLRRLGEVSYYLTGFEEADPGQGAAPDAKALKGPGKRRGGRG